VSIDDVDEIEKAICAAISQQRMISFVLNDHPRIGEPHDMGIIKGQRRLFFYQTAGGSRSGGPMSWRWVELAKISELAVLDRHFDGPRPPPSGRHHHWDHLIASVSRSTSP
jgi:hypothetical protein